MYQFKKIVFGILASPFKVVGFTLMGIGLVTALIGEIIIDGYRDRIYQNWLDQYGWPYKREEK